MAYTTQGYSPEVGPVLAENRIGFDPVKLLRVLLESKARNTTMLPTYLPNKFAVDALLDAYAKNAWRIVYSAPCFETNEMVQQHTRELLRQKVRNATGINIPGTFGAESLPEMIPIHTADDQLLDLPVDMARTQYVEEAAPVNFTLLMPQAISDRIGQPTPMVADDNLPIRKPKGRMRSVAGATAHFLSGVNTFVRAHQYVRLPDLLTSEMRVVEFGIRANQRNPQLYPRISLLCTANLSMVLDVYVNNNRLDVFHYGGRGRNSVTAPMSVKNPTFAGLITLAEFSQYMTGLTMAMVTLRDVVRKAHLKALNTKTLPEIR